MQHTLVGSLLLLCRPHFLYHCCKLFVFALSASCVGWALGVALAIVMRAGRPMSRCRCRLEACYRHCAMSLGLPCWACDEQVGKRKIAELGVAWPRRFCGVRALCPLLPRCPRQWLMRVHAARAKRVGVHYYDCVSSVALDRFCVSYLISPVALDRFCVSYQIIMFYVACAWSLTGQ